MIGDANKPIISQRRSKRLHRRHNRRFGRNLPLNCDRLKRIEQTNHRVEDPSAGARMRNFDSFSCCCWCCCWCCCCCSGCFISNNRRSSSSSSNNSNNNNNKGSYWEVRGGGETSFVRHQRNKLTETNGGDNCTAISNLIYLSIYLLLNSWVFLCSLFLLFIFFPFESRVLDASEEPPENPKWRIFNQSALPDSLGISIKISINFRLQSMRNGREIFKKIPKNPNESQRIPTAVKNRPNATEQPAENDPSSAPVIFPRILQESRKERGRNRERPMENANQCHSGKKKKKKQTKSLTNSIDWTRRYSTEMASGSLLKFLSWFLFLIVMIVFVLFFCFVLFFLILWILPSPNNINGCFNIQFFTVAVAVGQLNGRLLQGRIHFHWFLHYDSDQTSFNLIHLHRSIGRRSISAAHDSHSIYWHRLNQLIRWRMQLRPDE